MSRLAKNPIPVPSAVSVEVNGQDVKAKGPKGEMVFRTHNDVSVALQDGDDGKVIKLEPKNKKPQAVALWGTCWSRIGNLLQGVNEGYTKRLEIVGVGYRANMQGQDLVLSLGFSHEVRYKAPEGITITAETQTELVITGMDKQKVGQVAAEIRSFRPPEPYKGKGVRYKGEHIFRKEGKKK